MNGILLSAGYGNRLLPITKKIPKCLVKLDQQPILKIWIDKLINIDIKKILINILIF